MPITRADITGALKFIHSNNLPDRKGLLSKMLSKEHSARDVAKVLLDVEAYPEWAARRDLDVPAVVDGPLVTKAAKKKK